MKLSAAIPVQNDGVFMRNNNNLQQINTPEYGNNIYQSPLSLSPNNDVQNGQHILLQQQQQQQYPTYPFPQPKRKHYKITLIRPPPQPIQLPEYQPEIEEQTIVYVLVKKPDEPKIEIKQTEPAFKSSKPEVYFIKYQTKSEKDTLSNSHLSTATTSHVPSV